MRLGRDIRRIGLVLVCVMTCLGCHPDRFDDPVPIMLDRDRGVRQRLIAADQLGALEQPPFSDEYRRALHQLAWSDRQPIELRQHAIDRLIEDDVQAFLRAADRQIEQVDAWPALLYLFEQVAAHEWRSFTRTAVRSYARPSIRYADKDRPEHALIAALHPEQPVETVVYELFMGDALDGGIAHQAAAWTVLTRLHDESTLRAHLAAAPPVTPIVVDLQAAASVLDVLPTGREQLLWLANLRRMEDGRIWIAATERARALSLTQQEGLALRHLPLLAQLASREAMHLDVERLRSRIGRRLALREHVTRTKGVPDDWNESFEAHSESLPWGDLLAIDALLDALERTDVRTALFEQAEHDRRDTRSEHGGAFMIHGQAWKAQAFEPAFYMHDRRYIASQALIDQMQTALAHYHFHAQDHENAAYAAPGGGDLRFAARFGVHAVVLTLIDPHTLNVDYHQPDGVVIDLGNVQRDK